MLKERRSGILLHISSLSGEFGIGDLGPSSYRFAQFLKSSGQSYWQILPLNPTLPILGNSPYSSISAFACNPLFISPVELMKDGLLTEKEIEEHTIAEDRYVDYERVHTIKERLISFAFERFKKDKGRREEFERFIEENRDWLEDFSLFVVIKELEGGKVWSNWDKELRDRDKNAITKIKKNFNERIEKEKFKQFLVISQWKRLKQFCNENGIRIIGDIPIYVNYDSVDVWSNPEIFKLDKEKRPKVVAGVPPDYFSKTGQLWGNPVYNWEVLKERGFDWWLKRLKHNLELFDIVRIDHFRGFVSFWEVPYGEKTAINGRWVSAPYREFFETILKKYPERPIIAEDLGYITEDVRRAIKEFGFPGMKVLQFAFGDKNPDNPFLPHNHEPNYVIYTGTHDNNTTKGWFEEEIDKETKEFFQRYIGRKVSSGDDAVEVLILLSMMSVCKLCIIPMQDILKLGSFARMNTPSKLEGNWRWKLKSDELKEEIGEELYEKSYLYKRIKRD